jgi:hypothetical protein
MNPARHLTDSPRRKNLWIHSWTNQPGSRKDAKCAKVAKQRKDLHLAFLRVFAATCELY